MWESYRKTLTKYPRISLGQERRLIAHAKKGSQSHAEEIILRHIGFVIFRIHKVAFPEYLRRFGEDVLSESIPVMYRKINSYNLRYKDKNGNLKPVKFSSYIWKRIDGLIIDSLKREYSKDKLEKVLQ